MKITTRYAMSIAGLWTNGLEMSPNFIGTGASPEMSALYMTSLDHALEASLASTPHLTDQFLIRLDYSCPALKLDTGHFC